MFLEGTMDSIIIYYLYCKFTAITPPSLINKLRCLTVENGQRNNMIQRGTAVQVNMVSSPF